MKKLFTLIICLLFIPVVFAKDTVEITKVELETKSDKAVINNEPTFDGLEINCDIGFVEINDFVKYKVTIKNTYDEDFSIANKTAFDERNSIKYEFSGKEVLKANDSIDVYVTISYVKEIDDSLFVNGKYKENNKVVIELLNGASETFNPNTSSKGIMFIAFGVSVVMVMVSLFLLKKNKKLSKTVVLIMLLSFATVPILTKALSDIEITVNVAVEIKKVYKVVYRYDYHEVVKASDVGEDFNTEVCFPYYDKIKDEAHKYYQCDKETIFEDPKRYAAGEQVVIPNFKSKRIYTDFTMVNGESVRSCTWSSLNGEYYYLCGQGINVVDEPVVYWYYDKSSIGEYGFTYNDNDLEVMKFKWYNEEVNNYYQEYYDREIVQYWNEHGYAYIYEANEFTMPNHDVFIDFQYPLE